MKDAEGAYTAAARSPSHFTVRIRARSFDAGSESCVQS